MSNSFMKIHVNRILMTVQEINTPTYLRYCVFHKTLSQRAISYEGPTACLHACHWLDQGWPCFAGPVSSVWWHCVPWRLLPGAWMVLLPQQPLLRLWACQLPPRGGQWAGGGHSQEEAVWGHCLPWRMLPWGQLGMLSRWGLLCISPRKLSLESVLYLFFLNAI